MVGAPGTYTYRFKALASGATTLKMVYARPWDEHSAPADQFTVSVNVSETPVDSLPETPGFPWRWHPVQRFLRRMLNQATDQDSRETLVVGPEHDVVIDQAIVEAQPWWDAAARAVETLTPSVETHNDSSMAHISADGATSGQWGSASGSARIDVLGYDAGAYADGDWTDGNVGVGAQASANLLKAVASGQFESVAKVGDVEIVSNGDGSTSYIVGAHVCADATLGIDGLELSTTAIVGATLTAEGTATTDIGGLTAGVEGEAMIHVGARPMQRSDSMLKGCNSKHSHSLATGSMPAEARKWVAWASKLLQKPGPVLVAPRKQMSLTTDGKFKVDLSLGAALGVGAKLGVGFTVDVYEIRDNVVAAAGFVIDAAENVGAFVIDAAQHVSDAAEDVGAFVTDAAEQVGDFVVDAANEVKDAIDTVANKIEKAANSVGRTIGKSLVDQRERSLGDAQPPEGINLRGAFSWTAPLYATAYKRNALLFFLARGAGSSDNLQKRLHHTRKRNVGTVAGVR